MTATQPLRIGVIGAGAMGSLVAARLQIAAAKHRPSSTQIALIPARIRTPAACVALTLHPLGPPASSHAIRVSLSTEPPREGLDVAVLLTKTAFLAPLIQRLPSLLPASRPALVVSLMNGVGYEDLLAPICARHSLVFGVTSAAARFQDDGLHETGRGPTVIASKSHAEAAALIALMGEAGLEARNTESVQAMRWTKLVVNCVINPLTAIHRVRNGELLAVPGVLGRVRCMISEIEALAKAKGIVFQTDNLLNLVAQVAQNTKANQSSMFVDVLNKSRTEIEYMNGTIVRESKALGLLCPENTSVYEEIRQIERTYEA